MTSTASLNVNSGYNGGMVVIEPNAKFFVGVKAFIEHEGKLLILRQSDHYEDVGKWQLPGGRIGLGEETEELKTVLLREVQEECGEGFSIAVGEFFHVFRRLPRNGTWTILIAFKCTYRSGEIRLNGEHTEYAWITREEMRKYEFVEGFQEALQIYFEKYS